MAVLGINSEEFFALEPIEFYYALKTVGEDRRRNLQERYEVARFKQMLELNANPNIKEIITDVRKVYPFPWEEGIKQVSVEQSQEELLVAGKKIAMQLGAVVVDKHPDDPPRILAPKFRK